MEATKEKHATFTPGPWHARGAKISIFQPFATAYRTVATVEDEKDARLIAAAPDMYEVLQELADSMELAKNYGYEKEHAMIQEVLAKVDGGEG